MSMCLTQKTIATSEEKTFMLLTYKSLKKKATQSQRRTSGYPEEKGRDTLSDSLRPQELHKSCGQTVYEEALTAQLHPCGL